MSRPSRTLPCRLVGAVWHQAAAACLLLGLLPAPLPAQDAGRAEGLYRRACDGGDPGACNVLGLMYEVGEGVGSDSGRAASLYRRACDGGDAAGCVNLGILYEAGSGVGRDPERAAALYRRGCEAGEPLGCDRQRTLETRSGPDGALAAGDGAPADGFFTSGRVAGAESGEPLDETVVELPDLGVRVVTDAGGRVELGRLPPGEHRIRAERAGYAVLEGGLRVPGNAGFLLLLSRDPAAGDTLAAGRIVGRVTEEGGGGAVPDVEVGVMGPRGVRVAGDREGRFLLEGVRPGLVELRFERLGYVTRTAPVVVHAGRTVEVDATLIPRPVELDPLEVTVSPVEARVRSRLLERNGFYRRLERGIGTQLTRDDLELANPVEVSDLVTRIPGVGRRFDPVRNTWYAESRRGAGECLMPVFVDGVASADIDLNQIPPEMLDGIEFHQGPTTPIQYQGMGASVRGGGAFGGSASADRSCGVVLLWTRR